MRNVFYLNEIVPPLDHSVFDHREGELELE